MNDERQQTDLKSLMIKRILSGTEHIKVAKGYT